MRSLGESTPSRERPSKSLQTGRSLACSKSSVSKAGRHRAAYPGGEQGHDKELGVYRKNKGKPGEDFRHEWHPTHTFFKVVFGCFC